MADDDKQEKPSKKKAGKRVRKPHDFVLCWVNETAPETDEDGNEIEPGRQCYVVMDLPPGLTEEQMRNRTAIKRACHKAVFDLGLKDYGNKPLRVGAFGDVFEIKYEEKTITKLYPK